MTYVHEHSFFPSETRVGAREALLQARGVRTAICRWLVSVAPDQGAVPDSPPGCTGNQGRGQKEANCTASGDLF